MSVKDDFDAAVARSRTLPNQPPQRLLELYGLFKQATEGDVSGARPGMLDMKGRAKYDAWAGRKGMGKDEAMKAYVDLVGTLAR